MTKVLLYMTVLCVGIAVGSEVYYTIRPSLSQDSADPYGDTESMDGQLTLSQFVNNSTAYLANDTILIFLPGNHSLESELIVENVHSFSMFVWPASTSKVTINCDGHNARFEFRNISVVSVTGLEFFGCLENYIRSVDQFQLKSSSFIGNGQPIVHSTVLTIDTCAANLDKVTIAFIAHQEPSENCTDIISNTYSKETGIIQSRSSTIGIAQSWFEGNSVSFGGVIYDEFGSTITVINTTFINNNASDSTDCNVTSGIVHVASNRSTVRIFNSNFMQNVGVLIFGDNCNMLITHTKFIDNEYRGSLAMVYTTDTDLVITYSTFTKNSGPIVEAKCKNVINTIESTSQERDRSLNIRYSNFVFNEGALITSTGTITNIVHSTFISNIGSWVLEASDTMKARITHSKYVNNTVIDSLALTDPATRQQSLVRLATDVTVTFNEFINNKAGGALVCTAYYTAARNLSHNMFINNNAEYEIYIPPFCRPGLSLSLGSSRCIRCSDNWHREVIGFVVAAFIAGIALVIFMLVLNMTVAVGTLNGILFFAHIIDINKDIYFLPFTTPNFATVFISWLNLGIGFDVCFYESMPLEILAQLYKALLEVAFPTYVIILVIVVIVASEYSYKFAKIIGKGNPVAVLATMVLLSYARFLKVVITSFSLFYGQPAYGSRNVDLTKVESIRTVVVESKLQIVSIFLGIVFILLFIFCVIFAAILFFWQWLLRYQDKAIFKWVRYQKLRHFLEPYHAPYTAKYRYWTGLLLFVRLVLCMVSVLTFSLNPHVYLVFVILVVGGLILLKGVIAKRVYKNWALDVIETAIYFNLVAFSAFTWYNLDYGADKDAIAYTFIMIIFIFLLGVIVFHIWHHTRLYIRSLTERVLKWTSSKLQVLQKKPNQESPNDSPEELGGYQLHRSAADDQQPPIVTHTVLEITHNQEQEIVTLGLTYT